MRIHEESGGCFPTGRHYPGIAHLLRVTAQGMAEEWASDALLSEIPWVSLDTETTGRDPAVDRVVEVGAVIFRGGRVERAKGWLIQPGIPMPEEARAIHGISDEDLADQPSFAEVAGEILEFVGGALPLAYNAGFDRAFLHSELSRAGITGPLPPTFRSDVVWVDPLSWARELQKEEKSRALGEVCARLGITLENAHRATHDAEAAGHVMVKFLSDARVPRAYAAFLREQARLERRFEFERARFRS